MSRRATVRSTKSARPLPPPPEGNRCVSRRRRRRIVRQSYRPVAPRSPLYGERWGPAIGWILCAWRIRRFSTAGRLPPNAWPYRDYVIQGIQARHSVRHFVHPSSSRATKSQPDDPDVAGRDIVTCSEHVGITTSATCPKQLERLPQRHQPTWNPSTCSSAGAWVRASWPRSHKFDDPILQSDYFHCQLSSAEFWICRATIFFSPPNQKEEICVEY